MMLDSLWNKYWESRDVEARNALVLHYDDLIQKVCRGMKRRLPTHIDIHDLHSTGVIGLISAIESFDKAKNVPFPPWGILRIRGAIQDALRTLDWVPRLERNRLKANPDTFIPTILNGFSEDYVDEPTFGSQSLIDPKSDAPFERLVAKDQVKFVLLSATPKERQIVTEYHFHNKLMKSIGKTFKVSESMISRLYKAAIQKMRKLVA